MLGLGLGSLLLAAAATSVAAPADYDVRVLSLTPPRLSVRATLPVREAKLRMADSRPGDVPELDTGGWQTLVKDLECFAADGRALRATATPPTAGRSRGEIRGRSP